MKYIRDKEYNEYIDKLAEIYKEENEFIDKFDACRENYIKKIQKVKKRNNVKRLVMHHC